MWRWAGMVKAFRGSWWGMCTNVSVFSWALQIFPYKRNRNFSVSSKVRVFFHLYIKERGTWCFAGSTWVLPAWWLIWFHLPSLQRKGSMWPFTPYLLVGSSGFFGFPAVRQKMCYCREVVVMGCDGDCADPQSKQTTPWRFRYTPPGVPNSQLIERRLSRAPSGLK